MGGAHKIYKALNALFPTPGTSARVGRDERDEGGELARLKHAPARVLARARGTRKPESQTLRARVTKRKKIELLSNTTPYGTEASAAG